jgi:hypothetical protein
MPGGNDGFPSGLSGGPDGNPAGRAGFGRFGEKGQVFRQFCCHKILKSDLAALSKAGGRWYIPPATSRPQRPWVAFSGSLWTEAAPLALTYPFRLF